MVSGSCFEALDRLEEAASCGDICDLVQHIGLGADEFVGLGETYEDVEPFDPEQFVEALFA